MVEREKYSSFYRKVSKGAYRAYRFSMLFYSLQFMCHKKHTMLFFCDIKITESFYVKIGTRYANHYNVLIIK
jgi:hypothetical protein